LSGQTITVLGAGAMGSALSTPGTAGGHEVRLWGTWLDDELLDAVTAGVPHPRLGVRLDERTRCYRSGELAAALDGVTLVVLAVASEGVLDVAWRAAPLLPSGVPVLLTTKGFGRGEDDTIRLLPELLAGVLPAGTPLVVAGGPCKANEVAACRPTATAYAAHDETALRRAASAFEGAAYRIELLSDVDGLEAAAAMKNVYAIALGISDGLSERDDLPWHNLKAAVFARAVREMATLAVALGGSATTVTGLPGAGDLEVTGLSGRNKVYGARIGAGEEPKAALSAMRAAGQTVEGVPASELAEELVADLLVRGVVAAEDFRLLRALRSVLAEGAEAVPALTGAALPAGLRRTAAR
jgi:glycerol-3-phosphate dehydrogenase (NAD(P)+)